MTTPTTPTPWKLKAGRSIETPSGEFYLTYGHDKYGNPNFKDFCELDRIARLVTAAPALYAALKAVQGAFYELADQAGDVQEWNQGGIAYEASKLVTAALAAADGKEQP